MKKSTRFAVSLIVLVAWMSCKLSAQTIFSRFDFNSPTYTDASIGPNATAIDPDVIDNGIGEIHIGANCGGTKGIDLTIPNLASLFDQPEMGMTFRFRKFETRSDFFVRGGTSFYQLGSMLYISYRTEDGSGGFIDYGPFNTSHSISEDNLFHEYTFIYVMSTGLATVIVDNVLVWSNDGPDNRALYWTAAPDPIVGTVMDGNCSGSSILDYAYFFIPVQPLPIEFASFEVTAVEADAQLDWEMGTASAQIGYDIERSPDGLSFTKVGHVNAGDGNAHAYRDIAPGNGLFYYRVRAVGAEGESLASEIHTATLVGPKVPSLRVWPNPSTHGTVNLCVCGFEGLTTLTIEDLTGKQVMQVTVDISSNSPIDISMLRPGIYIFKGNVEGQKLQQRLIVQ